VFEEIAAIINAHSLAAVGTRRALFDDRGGLRLARYVPADATWILDAEGGGFYHTSAAPYVVHEIGIFGGSRLLLDWAEDQAREELSLAPSGARVVIQSTVLEEDETVRRLLQEAGYAVVCTWTHLEIELDAPPRRRRGLTAYR